MLAHMRPFLTWFSHRLVPTSRCDRLPALCLDAHLGPPSAQSPFARSGCYRRRSAVNASLEGRYSFVIALTNSCVRPPPLLTLSAQLYMPGLCRLLPVRAARWPFPTLSLQVLPEMPRPLPRRLAGCTCLFLPLQHRPSPIRQ